MLKRVVVEGPSMAPTLLPGQRLLVATLAYRLRAPRRGELAVVRHPHRPLKLVKRVAGVPGDAVATSGGPRKMGADEFWVVGDHPSASTDSAAWGPLPRSAFVGRVVWSYRPWGPLPAAPGDVPPPDPMGVAEATKEIRGPAGR